MDDKINELEIDLYRAWQTILKLLPEHFSDILESSRNCQSHDEAIQWSYMIIDKLLELTQPFQDGAEDRAYCPLCGDGSSSSFRTGYAYPEGLRRHLSGDGRACECFVFHFARKLAIRRFTSVDQRTAKIKKELENRRLMEDTFRIEPLRAPKVLDEDKFNSARSPERLSWAENRLKELGFEIHYSARVKSYTQQHGAFVVFADPRGEGELRFSVYKQEQMERVSSPLQLQTSSFFLRDNWTNDLAGKYRTRLAQSIESLMSQNEA